MLWLTIRRINKASGKIENFAPKKFKKTLRYVKEYCKINLGK